MTRQEPRSLASRVRPRDSPLQEVSPRPNQQATKAAEAGAGAVGTIEEEVGEAEVVEEEEAATDTRTTGKADKTARVRAHRAIIRQEQRENFTIQATPLNQGGGAVVIPRPSRAGQPPHEMKTKPFARLEGQMPVEEGLDLPNAALKKADF